MKTSSVTPPQRIQCEESVELLFFFTTYFDGAGPAGAAPQGDGAGHVYDEGHDQARPA